MGLMTFDRRTLDSTGAFLVHELEKLDPTINEPLVDYTWSRDIDIRTDVAMGDDFSSFTRSTFASPGGIVPTGKAWVSNTTTAVPGVGVDIGKYAKDLFPWAVELQWSLYELAKSLQVGRPIDMQKYDAMVIKHQMDTDEQVYIGDSGYGVYGLINSPEVPVTNAAAAGSDSPTGNGSSTLWIDKSPRAIAADINAVLNAAWAASGWKVMPRELRLPPAQFTYLSSTLVSSAGNMSILNYLRENTVAFTKNGVPLNISYIKWLTGAGASGKDRMLAYTKEKKYVRFPMVPLQRTPLETRSLHQLTTYYGRLGVVEVVYPETLAYVDGI